MIKSETGIRVSRSTAVRIKSFNKSNSYEENIIAFLDYFERTGSNPFMLKEHPIEVTMKGFDRVISILKNIEKNKIDVINERLRKLIEAGGLKADNGNTEQGLKSTGGIKEGVPISEEDITVEEVEQLITLNGNLNQQIESFQLEIAALNKKIFELKESGNGGNDSLKSEHQALKKRISELAHNLEKVVKPGTFGSNMQISSADYKSIIDSLKNLSR